MSKKNNLIFKSLLACSLAFSSVSNATIVEFITSQGNIEVNLFDQTTPKTVENFLQYIDESHYNNSVIHRVAPNFIVQGGGFEFSGSWPLTALTPNASVINEPIYSNVKGTIAMAKRGDDENSATNQWFFNLENNSQNLDVQNGGFTVFGQVISGMDVVEQIAQLSLCNIASDGSGTPVVKESTQTCEDLTVPGVENFVVIETITITNSSEVTAENLTPLENTLLNTETGRDLLGDEGSSGGSLGWLTLLTIGLSASYRRRVKK